MIKKEIIDEKYIHTYSDEGKMLKQISTGEIYSDAIDLIEYPQEYEEIEEEA